jgi:hypothetical protein
MLFSEVTTAPNSGGEIVAKAAGNDSTRKPRVVAFDSMLTDRGIRLILIVPPKFVDRAIDTQFGSSHKVFYQLPDMFVGVGSVL